MQFDQSFGERLIKFLTGAEPSSADPIAMGRRGSVLLSKSSQIETEFIPRVMQATHGIEGNMQGEAERRFVEAISMFVTQEPKLLQGAARTMHFQGKYLQETAVTVDYMNNVIKWMGVFIGVQFTIAFAEAAFNPADAAERIATTEAIVVAGVNMAVGKVVLKVVGVSVLFEFGVDFMAQLEGILKGLRKGGFDNKMLLDSTLSGLISAATVIGAIIPGAKLFSQSALNLAKTLGMSNKQANSYTAFITNMLAEGGGEVLGGLLASGLVYGQWTVGVADFVSGLAEGAGESGSTALGKKFGKFLKSIGINVTLPEFGGPARSEAPGANGLPPVVHSGTGSGDSPGGGNSSGNGSSEVGDGGLDSGGSGSGPAGIGTEGSRSGDEYIPKPSVNPVISKSVAPTLDSPEPADAQAAPLPGPHPELLTPPPTPPLVPVAAANGGPGASQKPNSSINQLPAPIGPSEVTPAPTPPLAQPESNLTASEPVSPLSQPVSPNLSANETVSPLTRPASPAVEQGAWATPTPPGGVPVNGQQLPDDELSLDDPPPFELPPPLIAPPQTGADGLSITPADQNGSVQSGPVRNGEVRNGEVRNGEVRNGQVEDGPAPLVSDENGVFPEPNKQPSPRVAPGVTPTAGIPDIEVRDEAIPVSPASTAPSSPALSAVDFWGGTAPPSPALSASSVSTAATTPDSSPRLDPTKTTLSPVPAVVGSTTSAPGTTSTGSTPSLLDLDPAGRPLPSTTTTPAPAVLEAGLTRVYAVPTPGADPLSVLETFDRARYPEAVKPEAPTLTDQFGTVEPDLTTLPEAASKLRSFTWSEVGSSWSPVVAHVQLGGHQATAFVTATQDGQPETSLVLTNWLGSVFLVHPQGPDGARTKPLGPAEVALLSGGKAAETGLPAPVTAKVVFKDARGLVVPVPGLSPVPVAAPAGKGDASSVMTEATDSGRGDGRRRGVPDPDLPQGRLTDTSGIEMDDLRGQDRGDDGDGSGGPGREGGTPPDPDPDPDPSDPDPDPNPNPSDPDATSSSESTPKGNKFDPPWHFTEGRSFGDGLITDVRDVENGTTGATAKAWVDGLVADSGLTGRSANKLRGKIVRALKSPPKGDRPDTRYWERLMQNGVSIHHDGVKIQLKVGVSDNIRYQPPSDVAPKANQYRSTYGDTTVANGMEERQAFALGGHFLALVFPAATWHAAASLSLKAGFSRLFHSGSTTEAQSGNRTLANARHDFNAEMMFYATVFRGDQAVAQHGQDPKAPPTPAPVPPTGTPPAPPVPVAKLPLVLDGLKLAFPQAYSVNTEQIAADRKAAAEKAAADQAAAEKVKQDAEDARRAAELADPDVILPIPPESTETTPEVVDGPKPVVPVTTPAALHGLDFSVNSVTTRALAEQVQAKLTALLPDRPEAVEKLTQEIVKEFLNEKTMKDRSQYWLNDAWVSPIFVSRALGFEGYLAVGAKPRTVQYVDTTADKVLIRNDIADTYTAKDGQNYKSTAAVGIGFDIGLPEGSNLISPTVELPVLKSSGLHGATNMSQGQAKTAIMRSDHLVRYRTEFDFDFTLGTADERHHFVVSAPGEMAIGKEHAERFEREGLGGQDTGRVEPPAAVPDPNPNPNPTPAPPVPEPIVVQQDPLLSLPPQRRPFPVRTVAGFRDLKKLSEYSNGDRNRPGGRPHHVLAKAKPTPGAGSWLRAVPTGTLKVTKRMAGGERFRLEITTPPDFKPDRQWRKLLAKNNVTHNPVQTAPAVAGQPAPTPRPPGALSYTVDRDGNVVSGYRAPLNTPSPFGERRVTGPASLLRLAGQPLRLLHPRLQERPSGRPGPVSTGASPFARPKIIGPADLTAIAAKEPIEVALSADFTATDPAWQAFVAAPPPGVIVITPHQPAPSPMDIAVALSHGPEPRFRYVVDADGTISGALRMHERNTDGTGLFLPERFATEFVPNPAARSARPGPRPVTQQPLPSRGGLPATLEPKLQHDLRKQLDNLYSVLDSDRTAQVQFTDAVANGLAGSMSLEQFTSWQQLQSALMASPDIQVILADGSSPAGAPATAPTPDQDPDGTWSDLTPLVVMSDGSWESVAKPDLSALPNHDPAVPPQQRVVVDFQNGQLVIGKPERPWRHRVDLSHREPPALAARKGLGPSVVRELAGLERIIGTVREALYHQLDSSGVATTMNAGDWMHLERSLAVRFGVPGVRGGFRGLAGGSTIDHEFTVGGKTFQVALAADLLDLRGAPIKETGVSLDFQVKDTEGLDIGEGRDWGVGVGALMHFRIHLKGITFLDFRIPEGSVMYKRAKALVGSNASKEYRRRKVGGPSTRFEYNTEYTVTTVVRDTATNKITSAVSNKLNGMTAVQVPDSLLAPADLTAEKVARIGRVTVSHDALTSTSDLLKRPDGTLSEKFDVEARQLTGIYPTFHGMKELADEIVDLVARNTKEPPGFRDILRTLTGPADPDGSGWRSVAHSILGPIKPDHGGVRPELTAHTPGNSRMGAPEQILRGATPTFTEAHTRELYSTGKLTLPLPKTKDGYRQAVLIGVQNFDVQREGTDTALVLEQYTESDSRYTRKREWQIEGKAGAAANLVIRPGWHPVGDDHGSTQNTNDHGQPSTDDHGSPVPAPAAASQSKQSGPQVTFGAAIDRGKARSEEKSVLSGGLDLNLGTYNGNTAEYPSHHYRGDAVYTVTHVKWKDHGYLHALAHGNWTSFDFPRFDRHTSKPVHVKVAGGVELGVPHVKALDLGLDVPPGFAPAPTRPEGVDLHLLDEDLGLHVAQIEQIRAENVLPEIFTLLKNRENLESGWDSVDKVVAKGSALVTDRHPFRAGRDQVPSDLHRGVDAMFNEETLRRNDGAAGSTGLYMVIKTPTKVGGITRTTVRVTRSDDSANSEWVRPRPDLKITAGGQMFEQFSEAVAKEKTAGWKVHVGGRAGWEKGGRLPIDVNYEGESGSKIKSGEKSSSRDIRRATAGDSGQEFSQQVTYRIEVFQSTDAPELLHQAGRPFSGLAHGLEFFGHAASRKWWLKHGLAKSTLVGSSSVKGRVNFVVPSHLTTEASPTLRTAPVFVPGPVTVRKDKQFAPRSAQDASLADDLGGLMQAFALPGSQQLAPWLPVAAGPPRRAGIVPGGANTDRPVFGTTSGPGGIDHTVNALAFNVRTLRSNLKKLLDGEFHVPGLRGGPVKVRIVATNGRWVARGGYPSALNFPEHTIEPEAEREVFAGRSFGADLTGGGSVGPLIGSGHDPTLINAGLGFEQQGEFRKKDQSSSAGDYLEENLERKGQFDYYVFDLEYEMIGKDGVVVPGSMTDGLKGMLPAAETSDLAARHPGLERPPFDLDDVLSTVAKDEAKTKADWEQRRDGWNAANPTQAAHSTGFTEPEPGPTVDVTSSNGIANHLVTTVIGSTALGTEPVRLWTGAGTGATAQLRNTARDLATQLGRPVELVDTGAQGSRRATTYPPNTAKESETPAEVMAELQQQIQTVSTLRQAQPGTAWIPGPAVSGPLTATGIAPVRPPQPPTALEQAEQTYQALLNRALTDPTIMASLSAQQRAQVTQDRAEAEAEAQATAKAAAIAARDARGTVSLDAVLAAANAVTQTPAVASSSTAPVPVVSGPALNTGTDLADHLVRTVFGAVATSDGPVRIATGGNSTAQLRNAARDLATQQNRSVELIHVGPEGPRVVTYQPGTPPEPEAAASLLAAITDPANQPLLADLGSLSSTPAITAAQHRLDQLSQALADPTVVQTLTPHAHADLVSTHWQLEAALLARTGQPPRPETAATVLAGIESELLTGMRLRLEELRSLAPTPSPERTAAAWASDQNRLALLNLALSDPSIVRSLSQDDHADLVNDRRQVAAEIARRQIRTTTEAEVTVEVVSTNTPGTQLAQTQVPLPAISDPNSMPDPSMIAGITPTPGAPMPTFADAQNMFAEQISSAVDEAAVLELLPWLRDVNPERRFTREAWLNCVIVAIATDMTLADSDLAGGGGLGQFENYQASLSSPRPVTDLVGRQQDLLRLGPNGSLVYRASSFSSVEAVMAKAPVGARGAVVVRGEGIAYGHAFNVVKVQPVSPEDTGVRFVDGQRGGLPFVPRPEQVQSVDFLPFTPGVGAPEGAYRLTPEQITRTPPAAASGGERETTAMVTTRDGEVPAPDPGVRPGTVRARRDELTAGLRAQADLSAPTHGHLGPNIFHLEEHPTPAFLEGINWADYATDQILPLVERLDLAQPRDLTRDAFDPAKLLPQPGVLRAGPNSQYEVPPVRFTVWFGRPVADTTDTLRMARQNMTETAAALRESGTALVLVTDVPRSELDKVDKNEADPEIAAMLHWARDSGIKLVNAWEVYHSGNPMRLAPEVAQALARRHGRGYATASDIVRLNLLHTFGGDYRDLDNVVGDRTEDLADVADTGYAVFRDRRYYATSAMISGRHHPFAQHFLDEIEARFEMSQPELFGPNVWDSGDRMLSEAMLGDTSFASRRHSIMPRSSPDLLVNVARRMGLPDSSYLSVLRAVGNRSGHVTTWEAGRPEEAYRFRAEQVPVVLRDVVATLVRGLSNRVGDLRLTEVSLAIQALPVADQAAVWGAAIDFILSVPQLAAQIKTVTDREMLAEWGPDGRRPVRVVPLPDDVYQALGLAPAREGVDPEGDWRLGELMRPAGRPGDPGSSLIAGRTPTPVGRRSLDSQPSEMFAEPIPSTVDEATRHLGDPESLPDATGSGESSATGRDGRQFVEERRSALEDEVTRTVVQHDEASDRREPPQIRIRTTDDGPVETEPDPLLPGYTAESVATVTRVGFTHEEDAQIRNHLRPQEWLDAESAGVNVPRVFRSWRESSPSEPFEAFLNRRRWSDRSPSPAYSRAEQSDSSEGDAVSAPGDRSEQGASPAVPESGGPPLGLDPRADLEFEVHTRLRSVDAAQAPRWARLDRLIRQLVVEMGDGTGQPDTGESGDTSGPTAAVDEAAALRPLGQFLGVTPSSWAQMNSPSWELLESFVENPEILGAIAVGWDTSRMQPAAALLMNLPQGVFWVNPAGSSGQRVTPVGTAPFPAGEVMVLALGSDATVLDQELMAAVLTGENPPPIHGMVTRAIDDLLRSLPADVATDRPASPPPGYGEGFEDQGIAERSDGPWVESSAAVVAPAARAFGADRAGNGADTKEGLDEKTSTDAVPPEVEGAAGELAGMRQWQIAGLRSRLGQLLVPIGREGASDPATRLVWLDLVAEAHQVLARPDVGSAVQEGNLRVQAERLVLDLGGRTGGSDRRPERGEAQLESVGILVTLMMLSEGVPTGTEAGQRLDLFVRDLLRGLGWSGDGLAGGSAGSLGVPLPLIGEYFDRDGRPHPVSPDSPDLLSVLAPSTPDPSTRDPSTDEPSTGGPPTAPR